MREVDLEYRPDPFGRLGFGEWKARRRRDPFGRLPGMDRDKYRADVRAKCREAFTKWEAELRKPPESNEGRAEGAQE